MRIEHNTPLSVKVARQLRAVLRDEYVQGGRIPGEMELAQQFGVSRGTVRQALSILEREGAILRRQGDGTYANHYVLRIAARVEQAYEFTELIRETGFDAELEVVGIELSEATEEEADQLKIAAGDSLLVVRKVFCADDAPAIFCVDKMPAALITDSYDEDELANPIFDFMMRRCHIQVDYMLSEIIPRVADAKIAEHLQLEPGTPGLEFAETSYSDANEPVLLSRVFYSDALIRFTVFRKKV